MSGGMPTANMMSGALMAKRSGSFSSVLLNPSLLSFIIFMLPPPVSFANLMLLLLVMLMASNHKQVRCRQFG